MASSHPAKNLEALLSGFINKLMREEAAAADRGPGNNPKKRARDSAGSARDIVKPGPSLHVSNLSSATTKEELVSLFKRHCIVLDATIRSKTETFCFGFVDCKSVEGATMAMFALQGKEVNGRQVALRAWGGGV